MKKILLVDDEYALVESLQELLQDEGYHVLSAANGHDGFARLTRDEADLVITDFMMPIANGRDLIRAMRALPAFESTPVVMMSSTSKSVALSDDAGGMLEVAAFIKKPFQWEKLLEIVERLIGKGDKTGHRVD